MYVHVRICCYSDQSANSISSHGDYSRAASISFRACSGAGTIRERHLFESSVNSVIYGTFFHAPDKMSDQVESWQDTF